MHRFSVRALGNKANDAALGETHGMFSGCGQIEFLGAWVKEGWSWGVYPGTERTFCAIEVSVCIAFAIRVRDRESLAAMTTGDISMTAIASNVGSSSLVVQSQTAQGGSHIIVVMRGGLLIGMGRHGEESRGVNGIVVNRQDGGGY